MSTVPHSIDPSAHDWFARALGAARTALDAAAGALRGAVAAVGFWLAIALPLSYLPLLANGFAGGEALPFAGLVGANAIALIVGHGHEPGALGELLPSEPEPDDERADRQQ